MKIVTIRYIDLRRATGELALVGVSGKWARDVVRRWRSPGRGDVAGRAMPLATAGGAGRGRGLEVPGGGRCTLFLALAPFKLPLHPYSRVDAAFVRFCSTVKGAREM
jgi:hypothetical protein